MNKNEQILLKTFPPSAYVAIDFGSGGTAWAYCRATSFEHSHFQLGSDEAPNIILNDKWPNDKEGVIKTRSSVLFKHNEAIAFGKHAEEYYTAHLVDEEAVDYNLFKRFKMQLYKDPSEYTVSECLSVSKEKTLPTQDVITGCLKIIKSHILETLNVSPDDSLVNENEIQWIITVPAVWSESAKQVMRLSAKNSGMTRVEISLEPEAASLTVLSNMIHSSQDKKSIESLLSSGLTCVVVDGGAGTIDIVSQHIRLLPSGSIMIEEITSATGGDGGSSEVDLCMVKVLEEILDDYQLDDFLKKNPLLLNELLDVFEHQKNSWLKSEDFPALLEIPKDLWEYIKREEEERPDGIASISRLCQEWCFMKNLSDDAIATTKRGSCFKISQEFFDYLHLKSKEVLKTKLNEVIQKMTVPSTSPRMLFFVGGFSNSIVMKNELKQLAELHRFDFEETAIGRHVPADLAVVNGAVLYGLNPHLIASRVMRFGYGVMAAHVYDDKRDPSDKVIIADDGLKYVNKLYFFVEKGQKVGIDDVVRQSFSPLFPNSRTVQFNVTSSYSEGDLYEEDVSLTNMGVLKVDAPEDCFFQAFDKFEFRMKFGGTTVHCVAFNEEYDINKEIDLQLE